MIEIVKAEPLFEIKVKLDDGAKMPEKAHDADAGFDLFSPSEFTVAQTIVDQNGHAIIDTGVHMLIPRGYVGMIKSKSGLNVKHGLTATGVVDAGYTGNIKVKLYNHSNTPYKINKGDKVAQIVIVPIPEVRLVEADALEETERGSDGFGSTGR